jgi:hypothetical protein
MQLALIPSVGVFAFSLGRLSHWSFQPQSCCFVLIVVSSLELANMKEEKMSESAAKFFRVTACSGSHVSVRLIQVKQSKLEMDACSPLGSNHAASLQSQIMGMWFEKTFRCKTPEKYRAMVMSLQAQSLHLGICYWN